MKRYKKNLLAAAAFLFCSLSLSAQSADHNYVKQETMLNASKSQKITSVQYYDGYSRPVLRAEDGTAGGGKYTFALTTYDNVGRVSESWLPAVGTTSSNFLTTSEVKSLSSSTYGDSYAYTCNHYDALGRTTSVDGIGSAWRSAGKKVTTAYGTNTWNEVRKYTAMAGNTTLSYSTCYSSGTLSVETVTDEDGKTYSVYKDATGKTVLERSAGNHDTYYVYDDMNRLRFVLPPCASDALASTGSWSMDSNDVLRDYAYYYEYDGRGRCIKKKLPGAEHVLYEYDIRDRMTFSQDGVQRTGGKWTFYVYDNLNRLTQQGENTSQAVSAPGVYLQNYYDSYENFRAALPNDIRNQYPNDTSDNAKGSLTGTVMNVFGSSEKIYTVYYYDIKGRVIKTIENNLMGGYNTTETTYTFSDQPATVTLTHTADGKLTQTEVYTYTYDHSDRISSVTHKLNSNTAVTLASYTYDNKGRMATKKLHGSSTNQLTYAYNIRSWLTGITSGKFTQNLTYNNGSNGFNGNITAMNWTANGSSHSYAFTYDGMNRMLNATHGTGAYTEKVTGYDKNGNITGLQRYNSSLVDNLSYTYNGNQLTKVEDATGNTNGFTNGANTSNEYTYDNNGNLTKDLNKGITNISYNVLSLPQVVTFSNGSSITYLYTADGRKLRTLHVVNGTTTTTDYSGNVIYENGTQKLLLTEEGYIDLTDSNKYYYYLKDHQGNNRVVVSSSGTVMETNHYYPFGGLFSTSTNVQPYKYNGKELDTKNGLNWYDYGARHYDAALGRWFVVDPLGEKYYSSSPFVYCNNNPLRFIDPNGKDGWDIVVGYGIGFVTNVIPGTGFLRDTYTPTDASDYNNALRGADNASMAAGLAMFVDGGNKTATGSGAMTAGLVVSAVSGGTATVVGGPVAAGGAIIVGAGTIEMGAGSLLMSNAETNKNAGYNRGKQSSVSNDNSVLLDKGSLSGTKKALKEVHEKVGGSLPKGSPGKFGSPQRGDSKKGYRLDPGHPGKSMNDPEAKPHINWWDYTKGKRNNGGNYGVIEID